MDTNTILALCAIFTVIIGIVGLGQTSEQHLGKEKPGVP